MHSLSCTFDTLPSSKEYACPYIELNRPHAHPNLSWIQAFSILDVIRFVKRIQAKVLTQFEWD